MELEVLRLGDLDPNNDIIVMHIDVGIQASVEQAQRMLERTRDTDFVKRLKKQGFMVLLSPMRGQQKGLIFESKLKRDLEAPKTKSNDPNFSAYDKAMQAVG